MALVANQKVGREKIFEILDAAGERLNAGDLNGQIEIHIKACRNDAEWDFKVVERFGGLFDEFLTVDEENRFLSALERFANHPARHDGFARTTRRYTDNALVFVVELVAHGVDKILLIRTQLNIHLDISFLKRRFFISPLCF